MPQAAPTTTCRLDLAMATLPRTFSSSDKKSQSNGAAMGQSAGKYKKSKRLSWTLGRKKSRDEAFVADGSGKKSMIC